MSTIQVEEEFDWRGSQRYRAKKGMGQLRKDLWMECRYADGARNHWLIMGCGNDLYVKELTEARAKLDELQAQLKDCLIIK